MKQQINQHLTWKECLKKGFVKQTKPSKSKMHQLLRLVETREEFLEEKGDESHPTLFFEAYYDIIKELLYAHLYKSGFTCDKDEFLLPYAKHHSRGFVKENKAIEELFAMKRKLRTQTPQQVKAFLEMNETGLKKVIAVLKQRLME